MSYDSVDVDDLAWPVTAGDCHSLHALGIAALIGIGSLAAWMLGNMVSIH